MRNDWRSWQSPEQSVNVSQRSPDLKMGVLYDWDSFSLEHCVMNGELGVITPLTKTLTFYTNFQCSYNNNALPFFDQA